MKTQEAEVIITEGVAGTWYYHLSHPDSHWDSLCGTHTMRTSMRLDQWGFVGHLKEKYCQECVDLFGKEKLEELARASRENRSKRRG